MAKRRVQIVRMRKGESRWQFVAHGAPYERQHAEEIKADYEGRGDKIAFLTIGKESA